MKGLDWFIARRYLASARGGRLLSLITWIALGGVTVGVTALIVVIGVMTGMQEDLRAKILGSTAHVIVLEQGSALRMRDYPRIMDTVRTLPQVTAAAPFILTQVVIIRDEYQQSADLYGVSLDTTRTPTTDIERQILSGELDLSPTTTGLPPILLGSGFADRMQLFRGDTVIVASFENLGTDAFGGLQPTVRQFEVTGTFTTGMYDYDTRNVYTSLETAQDLLGLDEDVAGGIAVRTVDPEVATGVAEALQERLGFPYYVESWITTNRALFSALRLEKLAMGIILYLIILVAAFNIISTLVMVVADRTREIGILKAMGMTRQGILRIFVLQGAWIGVIGTLFGTLFGLILCWVLDRYEIIEIPPDVYFVDRLPVSVQAADVLLIVGASIVVAFAATIYPSLQAARLDPVDAIRHD